MIYNEITENEKEASCVVPAYAYRVRIPNKRKNAVHVRSFVLLLYVESSIIEKSPGLCIHCVMARLDVDL
jgi:hypothetical protein